MSSPLFFRLLLANQKDFLWSWTLPHPTSLSSPSWRRVSVPGILLSRRLMSHPWQWVSVLSIQCILFFFFFLQDIFIKHMSLSSSAPFLQDDRDAFYVCDLGDVLKKHLRWARALPRVTPFYAVKCNDSRAVVMTLASLGAGFDCASKVCWKVSTAPELFMISCNSIGSTCVFLFCFF